MDLINHTHTTLAAARSIIGACEVDGHARRACLASGDTLSVDDAETLATVANSLYTEAEETAKAGRVSSARACVLAANLLATAAWAVGVQEAVDRDGSTAYWSEDDDGVVLYRPKGYETHPENCKRRPDLRSVRVAGRTWIVPATAERLAEALHDMDAASAWSAEAVHRAYEEAS